MGLLSPGRYLFRARPWSEEVDRVEIVSTLVPRFEHERLPELAAHPSVRRETHLVTVASEERGLVFVEGVLVEVLRPGTAVFWRRPLDLRIETGQGPDLVRRFDKEIAVHADAFDEMPEREAPVYLKGEVLDRGVGHVYRAGGYRVRSLGLREQHLDAGSIPGTTLDGVVIEMGLMVTYRVADAVLATASVADTSAALLEDARASLRASVGRRTLGSFDHGVVVDEVLDALRARARGIGLEVLGVGIRGVTLTPRGVTDEESLEASLN